MGGQPKTPIVASIVYDPWSTDSPAVSSRLVELDAVELELESSRLERGGSDQVERLVVQLDDLDGRRGQVGHLAQDHANTWPERTRQAPRLEEVCTFTLQQ